MTGAAEGAWDWLGYAAALLTTLAFVPQVWLAWHSRDLAGVSLAMYAIFTAGITLWLAYGWLLGSWPMVLANAVTLALALSVLALKWRAGRRRR